MIERGLSEMEVFAESVLTVLAMAVIMLRAVGSGNKQIRKEILGDDETLFFFTFGTSILSASLGLTKSLKTGPCRILQEGGTAGGFLTGRFLLLFVSCGATLVSKGIVLAIGAGHPDFALWSPLVPLATSFLPGLLLSILALGPSLQTLKMFIAHPSLLLLPAVTYFTFSSHCGQSSRIAWSLPWTLANIALSILGYAAFGLASYSLGVTVWPAQCRDQPPLHNLPPDCPLDIYLSSALPTFLLALAASLLFLYPSACCSCSALQLGALRPEDPLTELVIIIESGQERLVEVGRREEAEGRSNMALEEEVTGA
jgi:hypothetical protein